MIEQQQMVEEFHHTFGLSVESAPAIPDDATHELRVRLIQEEFDEVKDALAKQDLTGIAKELADLLYVIYGTAVSYGIDMDPVFREVHRSNLSKVGGHKREDGKWVKPATYSPAQIGPILTSQVAQRHRSSSAHVSQTPDVE
jgi:predicted HAD superfamily Cof-like phosphohydrolase